MVISKGTVSVFNVAFVWLGRFGDQPTRLKDAQGLVKKLQAFVFGANEEDVLTQHLANLEATAIPKETDAVRQSQTHV